MPRELASGRAPAPGERVEAAPSAAAVGYPWSAIRIACIAALAIAIATLATLAIIGGSTGGTTSPPTAAGPAAGADEECADVEAPEPKPDGGARKPHLKLDPAQTNTVTFETSCGDFTVTLDAEGAPETTASFASLARSGFYDDTVFHRIVPGFVIQGGDPTGTGTGGPGYTTVDEPPADAGYTRGVVAMAKTATEPPGTAGSQFYVVTGADAGLPPEYAIVGEVSDGMDTVMRIDALGTPTEQPSRPVLVERVSFDQS